MASSPAEAAGLGPESSSSVLAAWTAQTTLVSLLGGFNGMAFYHPPEVHAFCFPCRFGLGPPLSHALSHVTESGEGGPSSRQVLVELKQAPLPRCPQPCPGWSWWYGTLAAQQQALRGSWHKKTYIEHAQNTGDGRKLQIVCGGLTHGHRDFPEGSSG